MKRLLLLALVACGGAKPAGPPPPPRLVVRDPGAEPRRVVRFELAPHASERAEVHTDLSFATSVTNTVLETGTKSVQFPTLTILQRSEVTDVLPDGSARIRVDNERVTTESTIPDPKYDAMFDRILERLRRRHVTFRLFPDGTRTEVVVDTGRSAPSSEPSADSDIDVIFPPTPVGVGAEWTVTRTSPREGVQWRDTRTYHLRALDDTTASVELEIAADAPPQPLAVSPNASSELTLGKLTATGQFQIPLHGLVPTGGGHLQAELRYRIVRKDLRIDSAIQLQRADQFQPAPPD